ncbi:nuclear transport factor 2 family protein [Novosphingobium huizhouense]|uniref:nuclear transport factor 2 family protein n=1 Tax=Novosphingobium huizhouense TaxID=2866625 RepID=UPI001CD8F270|nr:nuclear transport factor 2 family protein [Novosphingobium huizhouense]
MNIDRLDQVRTLVTRIYDLAGAGDLDAIGPLLSDDFVFTEADDLPIGGTYRGFAGYRAVWGEIGRRWSSVASQVIDLTVSENRAIGLIELKVVSAQHGSSHVLSIAEAFEITPDLKVRSLRPFYFDSAEAARSLALD